jgi:four helix bundle protein
MIQESGKIKEFTDLTSWQKAHNLALFVYKATDSFPQKEIFGITQQMRRAAVSIGSNIAEGFGRQGYKEKVQFYYIAHGSLTELKSQLLLAKDLGYLSNEKYDTIDAALIDTHKVLQGLISKSKSFLNPKS